MSKSIFKHLVFKVGPQITKDTNYGKALGAEVKLTITLRYLSTGSSFRSLAHHFTRGDTTIGMVIVETTEVIWKNIADRYEQLWSLPHCVGSIDGKYVGITFFKKSGSRNFNYKGYFSVQLMASADADGCFITIDVGDLGRNSDGGVFHSSHLGCWLDAGGLNLPLPESLSCDENKKDFPYFF